MSASSPPVRPPRLARALVAVIVGDRRAVEVRADLLEVMQDEVRRRGPRAARRRYWLEVIGLLRWRDVGAGPPLRHRLRGRLEGVVHDLRHGIRALRRRPATTAIAVVTLAIGVGLSTSMFSLLEAVVLRPLRLPESHALTRLSYAGAGAPAAHLSGPDFEAIRDTLVRGGTEGQEGGGAFREMAAVGGWLPTLVTDNGARLAWAGRSSWWFFRMLGVEPLLGRDFVASDVAGAEALILGHEIWQSAFAGDPDIIGRTVQVPPRAYTVVGVLPPDLELPNQVELWTTLDMGAAPWMRDRSVTPFRVYARLADDTSLGVARERTSDLAARLAADHPDTNAGRDVTVERLQSTVTGNLVRPLTVLLGAVLLVLLVACTNVANILLASGVARSDEFAMLLALGCTPGRLVRRMLLEATLVAAAGAGLGVLAAAAALDGVRIFATSSLPRLEGLAINGTVLAFATLMAGLSAFAAGLTPALRAAARQRSAAGLGVARTRWRGRRPGAALLTLEFATCAVLLVGAGLFLRSLGHLHGVEVGVDYEGVQTFRVAVGGSGDPVVTTDAIRARLQALPGVDAVAATSHLPLTGAFMNIRVQLPDDPVASVDRPSVHYRMVSPGYFEGLGIGRVAGRTFDGSDGPDGRPVAVVNAAAARALWGRADALGQLVALGDRPPGPTDDGWLEVVGVVTDVRQGGPAVAAAPAVYVPHAQAGQGWDWIGATMGFVVRSVGPALGEERLRSAVREVGAAIPVYQVASLARWLHARTGDARFAARLLEIFSALASVLAAVGIYGLVAFDVRARTRELGVRMALGEGRGRVQRSVVVGALRVAGTGAVIGGLVALGVSRAIASQLHGVGTADPATYLAALSVLVVAAVAAAWMPARRAAALDPCEALRSE